MTIDRLRAHYGLSRTPFGRDLAPGQLFQARGHQEAVARLTWLVGETTIGVVTGEVGAGKTVAARAATATLDTSRHSVVYLPNPMVGARGIHHLLVTALGAIPKFHRPALIAQTADLLAAETDERRKTVVLVVDLCRPRNYADSVARNRPERGRRWAWWLGGVRACRHSHRLSRSAKSGSAGV